MTYTQLTDYLRYQISALLKGEFSKPEVTSILNVVPSTICRNNELRLITLSVCLIFIFNEGENNLNSEVGLV